MALPEVTMAREAADALLSMLDGAAADRPVEALKKVLSEQLIVRGSTAPPSASV
jgi:DNA-binding LacI/PurR family transcriptional regulator